MNTRQRFFKFPVGRRCRAAQKSGSHDNQIFKVRIQE
jgi:hypothetical protein